VCALPSHASPPRVGLCLCGRPDARRPPAQDPDDHRGVFTRVSGDPRRAAAAGGRRAGDVGRALPHPGRPGPPALGQWPRIHGHARAGVAGDPRRAATVHRARQPVGERLLRELQRQAPRRALGPRAIRHALGGQGAHRALAAALQHGEAPWITGLPTSSPRGNPATSLASRPGGLLPQASHRTGLVDRTSGSSSCRLKYQTVVAV